MGRRGIGVILLLGIFVLLIGGVDAVVYVNMSDGFSVSAAGITSNVFGITTNLSYGAPGSSSDFWTIDDADNFVYHLNRAGTNCTGANCEAGFSISVAGASDSRGITTNGSDFWLIDTGDDFVYHLNRAGTNCTGANCEAGFSISAESTAPLGITTNGSDLWIVEATNDFVHHFNRAGTNCTGANCEAGFSISVAGSSLSSAITTNNSDFWIADNTDDFIYHFDRNGNNLSDGFKTNSAGADLPRGITTNGSDFWIVDSTDVFVYHFAPLTLSINFANPSTNNSNFSNDNLDINFTIQNNSPIDSIWYSNDSYSVNLSLGSGGTYFNITNITWSEGKHNVTIYMNDTVGNLNWSTRSFTIDLTKPTISLVNISTSSNYFNQSDGFGTSAFGSSNPAYITSNGSDFWIIDVTDLFVYHIDRSGNNQTDGFSTTIAAGFGSNNPSGIATNGSDFWVSDNTDDFIHHLDRTGNNQTDGFGVAAAGSAVIAKITTNGSDFWTMDSTDNFVYHFNRTGGNCTSAGPVSSVNAICEPGFKIDTAGISASGGITTNGSDFWITDQFDNFVYHFDKDGNNQTDGFSVADSGIDTPLGITTNASYISGTESNFWITDNTAGGVFTYHFLKFLTNTQTGNNSQNYIYIGATASDVSSLSSLNISLYNSGGIVSSSSTTSTSLAANFQNLADGVYYVNISANDSIGNINSTSIYSFAVDTVNPSITFSCDPNPVTAGSTLTCTCSGTDATSGVQTTSYTTNPSTATTGTFTTSCLVTDYAGNSGNSSVNYTVNAASSGSGGSSSSSGSSGSSSSTSSSTTEISAEPISNVTNIIASIAPEQTAIIPSLDFGNTFIKEIQIDVNKTAEDVKINVVAYDEKPRGISVEKEGEVYRYLRIETENLNPNLEKAKIILQIIKSDVSNQSQKENVALFKLDEINEAWNEVSTRYLSEDDLYYYYEAELNSFSYFAIAQKTFVQEIISEITKSYEEASKNLLTLIAWWLTFAIIVIAIVIVLILVSEFFAQNKIVFYWIITFVSATALIFSVLFITAVFAQEINKNILAAAVWWIVFATLITAALIVGILMSNFFSRGDAFRK